MNVSRGKNWVLSMDVVQPDTELLVVTENGYGKRTDIEEYPRKGRGTMGVKTATLTDKKGGLAGALIVREHQELVFISQNGMVQRTGVRGISRYGRASQGVKLMNLRDDDRVSAVALVVEDSAETAAQVAAEDGPVDAGETTAQPPHVDPAPGDDVVTGDVPDAPEASADGDVPDVPEAE
jgi:DNA gyrase subunit A